jgi:hypothetical protein
MFNRNSRSRFGLSNFQNPNRTYRIRPLDWQRPETTTMPAISKFRGIIVRLMQLPYRGLAIYANLGEEEVVVDAETLRVISGPAPALFVELILEWAQLHSTDLKSALAAVQARRAPCAPVPLV